MLAVLVELFDFKYSNSPFSFSGVDKMSNNKAVDLNIYSEILYLELLPSFCSNS